MTTTSHSIENILNYYFPQTEIDDNAITNYTTWSSQKIQQELDNVSCCIDDDNVSNETTWSSQKIVDEVSFLDCGTF